MRITPKEALKGLGELIDKDRFSVRLVEYRQRPAIRVTSLNSCSMTDTIVAEPRGELVVFCWSWGDLVGTSSDLRRAAEIVMRVLDIEESPILPR
ncbi:hypothetical protein [Sphaerimonospora thailandensis]|uniref:Uncharacterized protein n=1 Tax=Sphaerimonospora thailandensis TaxID=795644 RepID=A0A8J3RC34_9ACTN|nr:hypothetical protein [Sphaerimonospora thailandensis]GIH72263.1 hypothetical protein Mth01_45160 [Sphaerimonospora thailandensis]